MRRLFRQFSFPGGIPSHVAPETPGSIHEGGELGYALVHAYGAAFDNPDLLVCCVVGDGEAETGPLAASWHSNKFLNPATDGAVLPVLHLNGYKIANPTVLARIPRDELRALMEGYGYAPRLRRGRRPGGDAPADGGGARRGRRRDRRDPGRGARRRARAPAALADDRAGDAQGLDRAARGRRPSRRGHVPLPPGARWPSSPTARTTSQALEAWMRGYRPEELFDADGRLVPELAELAAARASSRMGANPAANGGELLRDLRLPDFRDYARRRARAGRHVVRGDARARRVAARRRAGQPGDASGSSAPTRPRRTG